MKTVIVRKHLNHLKHLKNKYIFTRRKMLAIWFIVWQNYRNKTFCCQNSEELRNNFWLVTKKLLYLRTNSSLQFLFLLSGKVSEGSNNLVDFQNLILENEERHFMGKIEKSNLLKVEAVSKFKF